MTDQNTLLELHDLKMYFPIRRGLLKRTVGYVRAVDGVSFDVCRGETLGLVGESGCGKTTLGRCVVRAYKPTDGRIIYHSAGTKSGDSPNGTVDFAQLNARELRSYRHEIQMIFQDPYSSLNPRMTVLDIVAEPLIIHKRKKGDDLKAEVGDL